MIVIRVGKNKFLHPIDFQVTVRKTVIMTAEGEEIIFSERSVRDLVNRIA